MATKKAIRFSQAYNRGNFGNAYESQDFDAWHVRQPGHDDPLVFAGLILGFFSSYEDHEIEGEWLDHYLQAKGNEEIQALADYLGIDLE